MSFSEESLEDKIAAIMRGNYNFGPPIVAPKIAIPVAVRAPVAAAMSETPLSVTPSVASTSPVPVLSSESARSSSKTKDDDSAISPLTIPTSIKSQQQSNTAAGGTGSSKSATPTEDVSEKASAPIPTTKSTPSRLQKQASALVGFGDVYEDSTAKVEYKESDLHRDAVADGYGELGELGTAASFKFGDVYTEEEVESYDRQGDDGRADELSGDEGEADGTETAPLSPTRTATVSKLSLRSRTPSPEPQEQRPVKVVEPQAPTPLRSASAESEPVKVQPQLDFIPLSARNSSLELTAVEGNGMPPLSEESAGAARQGAARAGRDSPPVTALPLAASLLGGSGKAGSTATAPASTAVVMQEADSHPEDRNDAVHSLLFGDGANLDESGEYGEDQHPENDADTVEEDTGLSFAPDDVNMETDSLDDGDQTREQEVSEDLMQTVRTTLPVSAAVRAPYAGDPAPSMETEKKAGKAVAGSSSSKSLGSTGKPPAGKTAPAAPSGKAVKGELTSTPEASEPAAEAAVVLPLPPKPRATTPSSLAREKAAFLLPTIVEEKPPAPVHVAKPAAVKSSHASTGLPVKVTAVPGDTTDRSHFLARISAATSVAIEKPPAVVRERSTTPTSIPKPAGSRSTTPPSTSRPSSAGSTSSTSRAHSTAPASAPAAAPESAKVSGSTPRTVLRSTPAKTDRDESQQDAPAPKRSASPPSQKKRSASPPTSSKKSSTGPVLMSSTSADEIALASGTKPPRPSAKTVASDSAKASKAHTSAPSTSSTGVNESTLLSSPPPEKEAGRKDRAVGPVSEKKNKAAAWVIGADTAEEPHTPSVVAARVSAIDSAHAHAQAQAHAHGETASSAAKHSRAPPAAWVIEPHGGDGAHASSLKLDVSMHTTPVKPPTRSRSPESASRPAAAPSGHSNRPAHVTSTAPVNASASAAVAASADTFSTPGSARSRAVSPNTTARSVSRIASAHTPYPTSLAEENPHPERAVKVAVRIRPFTSSELQEGHRRTISMNNGSVVIVNPKSFSEEPDAVASIAIATENRQWAHLFDFDNVLWNYNPETRKETYVNQIELHRSLGLDIVENALQGVSSSCFAYGHTCTGKTYSLFGADMIGAEHGGRGAKVALSLARFSIGPESGLIQRVFHDIIRLSHKSTRMFVTFMEIYNEKIRDLLVDHPVHQSGTSDMHSHSNGSTSGRIHAPTHVAPSADTLKLREHPTFGPYVENLVKMEVFSVEDALRLIAKGQASRSSAQTIWNANSSRSHAVVTLELTPTEIDPSKQFTDPRAREVYENSQSPHASPSKPDASGERDQSPGYRRDYAAPVLDQVVRVQMVDLAGSEKDSMRDEDEHGGWAGARMDSTPVKSHDALVEREKNELRLIRRSLSTLGYIIKALTKGASMRSLPYRDCTLTFLLKDALCGRNHTTMLATVSPSHTCYEETLSTLRYAERLCEVHNNRRSAAVAAGTGNLPNAADSALHAPRKAILDEFRRVHQGLIRDAAAHSDKSRDFIRQMLLETQSRPARPSQSVSQVPATPASSSALNATFLPVFTKPLSEITDSDLEELKNSYRRATSEVVEMQIDMDALRTDRDTLMSELRTATDLLNELDASKTDAKAQTAGLTKYLRAAEKELADLHALLKKRDETVDRLLSELSEEKQARSSAEQAYQTRSKDFLARFEALKKENKVLAGSLETVGDKQKSTADDKKDQAGQIERLRQLVKLLTQQKDAALAEAEKLRADHAEVGKKFDAAHVQVGKLEDVASQVTALTLQAEKARSDLGIITSERDSLMAMLAQKDTLLQVQAQQSERTIRTLQMKQASLERSLAVSAATRDGSIPAAPAGSRRTEEEYQLLEQRLSALLSSEGEALLSDVADTHKLTAVVRDMGAKLQELEDAKAELAQERAAREALQRQVSEQAVTTQVSQVGKSAQEHQITVLQVELLKLQEAHKKSEQAHGVAAAVLEGNKASLEEQVTDLQRDLLATKDALALTKARLLQQTNLAAKTSISSMDYMKLQAESAALKDQLILCQRDAFAAKEELRAGQESMQAEYASMWSSVQELSKLDALKDQSIQDLIADRDKAVMERDSAFERYAAAKGENAQLMQEIQDIDIELLHAVEAGEYRLSPRGQHKSIMIHNVSDRTMFGLARRQQHQPSQQRPPGSSGALTFTTPGSAYATSPPGQFMTGIQGMQGMQSPPAAYHNSPNASLTSTPVLTFNPAGQHSTHATQQQRLPPAVTSAPSAAAQRPPPAPVPSQSGGSTYQRQVAAPLSQSADHISLRPQQLVPRRSPPQSQSQSQSFSSSPVPNADSQYQLEPAPYLSQGSSQQLRGSNAGSWSNSGAVREEKSSALTEEEKLEKELQELSFMEDKVKHKMHHLKSASTLTSASASFSTNVQTLQQSSSARKRG